MGVSPDVIVALLGGEGIASVIAAVSAFRAHTNSKQLQRNHGSSVADAVARIEAMQKDMQATQETISTELKSHRYQLGQASDRIRHLEASLVGVRDDMREEVKARRRELAALEDDIEQTLSRKERPA